MSDLNLASDDSYHSIEKASEGFYKEKGSKFFAFAYPVQNETEIKHQLETLRQAHPNARHHCYAFILNKPYLYERANDDGEPKHSAGTPILNQIRALGLENVLLVVIRYFGGKKLGISGLIQAYKTASESALAEADLVEKTPLEKIHLHFPYERSNEVNQLLHHHPIELLKQSFGESCSFILGVKKSQIAGIEEIIQHIPGIEYEFEKNI